MSDNANKAKFSHVRFGERFKKLLQDTDKEDLISVLEVSASAFRQWTNGYTLPTGDKLIKLANYFNVSTDYLLGLTKHKTPDMNLRGASEYLEISQTATKHTRHVAKMFHAGKWVDNFLSNVKIESLFEAINDYVEQAMIDNVANSRRLAYQAKRVEGSSIEDAYPFELLPVDDKEIRIKKFLCSDVFNSMLDDMIQKEATKNGEHSEN